MGRIDTSKYLLGSFFLLTILSSIIPLIFGYDLISVDSYHGFTSLLDKSYLSFSYFGQIILANIDYANFSFFHLLASLIKSLNIINLLMIFLVSYLIAAYYESNLKKFRSLWISIIAIYFIGYVIIALTICLSFSISTLNTIIMIFKGVGIIMLLIHCVLILLSGFGLWQLKRTLLNH